MPKVPKVSSVVGQGVGPPPTVYNEDLYGNGGGVQGKAEEPKHSFYGNLPVKKAVMGGGGGGGEGGANAGRRSRRSSREVAPSVNMSEFFTAVSPLKT